MFEVGQKVVVNSFSQPKIGEVFRWYFDEGNVWVVRVGDEAYECCDSELSPA